MAAPLPAPLRTVDISSLAKRAAQLEKFKPVIAYWCDYYVVQKILQKGLHTVNDECMVYTTTLMDKLERWKAENATNDAIHDDMAAQAYVEQFALETFERAEKQVRSNKVTAQTADTYQAAATFLELLNIWQSPLGQEVSAKSKYAKFHALRIAKALKAGEDPNASNPVLEAEPPNEPPLDPNDPEVRRIHSLQPTVEDGSDTSRPTSTHEHPPLQALHSPPSPPIRPFASLPRVASQPSAPAQHDVSPLDSSPKTDSYFPPIPPPRIPTFTADTVSAVPGPVDHLRTSPPAAPLISPQDYYNTAPSMSPAPSSFPPSVIRPTAQRPPSHSHLPLSQIQAPQPQNPFPPPQPPFQQYTQPLQPPAPQPPAPQPQAPQPRAPQPQAPQPQLSAGDYRRDDEAVVAAQKHAKWAISALNFEDVDTAVKELRIALRALGAS